MFLFLAPRAYYYLCVIGARQDEGRQYGEEQSERSEAGCIKPSGFSGLMLSLSQYKRGMKQKVSFYVCIVSVVVVVPCLRPQNQLPFLDLPPLFSR